MTEIETKIDVSLKTNDVEVEPEEKAIEVNGHTNGNGEVVEKELTKASSEKNGDLKTTESEEAPAVDPKIEEEDNVVEQPKKEEEAPSTPKVLLHQPPPGRYVPSMSPFCLKLETFFRLNTIPYENHYSYKVGKNGKVPWIEYKGERKCDTNIIIPYLNETFDVNADSELSAEQLAIGRAVKSMLEENTYWAYIYSGYVDNFNEFKKVIAPDSGAGIGFSVSMKMNQRKARSQLDGQGIGRHSREEIYEIAQKDIASVSVLLGDNDYLFGKKPTSYDCTLFGLFANILWGGIESPMNTYIKENASNLVSFCERMKELCWHDWPEMVLGEKPEPQLKKGFSFRKNKKRTKTPKEAPSDQEHDTAAAQEAEDTTADEIKDEQKVETETEENKTKEEKQAVENKHESETEEETINENESTVLVTAEANEEKAE